MTWLWGRFGGHALFDPYSIQHVVWFFAITVALAAARRKHIWAWVLGLAAAWEVAEWWIVDNMPGFPFAGREDLVNKVVGDPVSDVAGFLLGWFAIKAAYGFMRHRQLGNFPELLRSAEDTAARAHSGQQYGEFPYTYHLFETRDVLAKFGFLPEDCDAGRRRRSQRLALAAILHDTLEDTELTYKELCEGFGKEIADLVFAVTNEQGANRRERFARTCPKIRSHPDAIVLKLADRIANVIHALQANPDILDMYRREWPVFERELRVQGECDGMWDYLEKILMEARP
jgi:guanosine-3',5'-bis(diphosphate) 3'-pyrophosphohydrolase